jgi:antitoxin (DNA-binding transcriptional repressor) of toxin-antitoxin stability system
MGGSVFPRLVSDLCVPDDTGVHRQRFHSYNADMNNVSVQDLLRDPLGLLKRVEAGEHVIVVRDNSPIAEIRPVALPVLDPRPYGLAAGAFTVPEDFDAPLPEGTLRDFEGQ